MFKPFHRLEGSRNRETGGIGLGLAIADCIAKSHGGVRALSNAAQHGFIASLKRRSDQAGKSSR